MWDTSEIAGRMRAVFPSFPTRFWQCHITRCCGGGYFQSICLPLRRQPSSRACVQPNISKIFLVPTGRTCGACTDHRAIHALANASYTTRYLSERRRDWRFGSQLWPSEHPLNYWLLQATRNKSTRPKLKIGLMQVAKSSELRIRINTWKRTSCWGS